MAVHWAVCTAAVLLCWTGWAASDWGRTGWGLSDITPTTFADLAFLATPNFFFLVFHLKPPTGTRFPSADFANVSILGNARQET